MTISLDVTTLLAPVRSRFVLGLVLLFFLPSVTSASEFQLDQYTPAEVPRDGFALRRPVTQGHLNFGVQIQLSYALNPLVVEGEQGVAESERFTVVNEQLNGHVVLTLGLWDRLTVFGHLPVVLVMDGDRSFNGFRADGSGLSDIGFGARVRLLGDTTSLLGLAAQARLTIPTAEAADDNQDLSGDGTISGHPEILAELRPGPLRITANLGVKIRSVADIPTLDSGSELTYGLGGLIPLFDNNFRVQAHVEVYGSSKLNNFLDREVSSVELLGGLKVLHPNGFIFGVAAGPGLSRGAGTPDIRAIGMLGFQPWPQPNFQSGGALAATSMVHRGIQGCPSEGQEDLDGFEDEDGCPDPDNDKDGIMDINDKCPLEPEDKDGFEDTDGCPDPDNDKDTIVDKSDKCPLVPEDIDGFDDEDGCPEPDNDDDGFIDINDPCPFQPGKLDGCPSVKPKVAVLSDRISFPKIYFDTDSARIRPESLGILSEVARALNKHPNILRVRIEGHADIRGDRMYNIDLSRRRARSVMKFLSRRDVEPNRMEAEGYGPDRPFVEGASTQGEYAMNRRVEVKIVQSADKSDTAAVKETP